MQVSRVRETRRSTNFPYTKLVVVGRGGKQKVTNRPLIIYVSIVSHNAAADGDAISDGELAHLDAGVHGEPGIEVLDGGADPAVKVRHWRVFGQRHRATPERVVVDDDAADADKAEKLLVVPHVVGLVGVHKRHVEPPQVPVVGEKFLEAVQPGALAEVNLVLDAGLLDELAAHLVIVFAFGVNGNDLAVVGQGERCGEQRVTRVDANLDGVLGAGQLDQHPQQLRLVRRRRHEPPAWTQARTATEITNLE
ncbi:hypothetical protein EJB05_49495, partial [Eragrostis curvula]